MPRLGIVVVISHSSRSRCTTVSRLATDFVSITQNPCFAFRPMSAFIAASAETSLPVVGAAFGVGGMDIQTVYHLAARCGLPKRRRRLWRLRASKCGLAVRRGELNRL